MSTRKTLWTFGARPHTVSVYTESIATGDYVRCQHRVRGQRRTRSWPNTSEGRREAKAYGQTLAMELRAPAKASPVTLAQLWEAYTAAEFEALRPKTRRNYAASWRAWELYAGRETVASTISREGLDGFRRELRRLGIAVNRIRKHFDLVKHVFRFAVDREIIPPTKVTDYRVKVAKDDRPTPTVEYRPADSLAIIAALDPKSSTVARVGLLCDRALLGCTGQRDPAPHVGRCPPVRDRRRDRVGKQMG